MKSIKSNNVGKYLMTWKDVCLILGFFFKLDNDIYTNLLFTSNQNICIEKNGKIKMQYQWWFSLDSDMIPEVIFIFFFSTYLTSKFFITKKYHYLKRKMNILR